MKPTVVVITGDHFLVRGVMKELAAGNKKVSFIPSQRDFSFFLSPPPNLNYFAECLAEQKEIDQVLLGALQDGKTVIVEQWYIGILAQIGLLQDESRAQVEDTAFSQYEQFNQFPKKVLYVSVDIEKWSDESDVSNKRQQLENLSDVIDKMRLVVENVNGDDTSEYVRRRIQFLLADLAENLNERP